MHHQREARVIGGLDTLAGIWLFVSSFFFAQHASLAWSLAITGVVVTVLSFMRAMGYQRAWPSWTNLFLGLWTVASPWILTNGPTPAAAWNAVVTGLVIANLALASAMATDTEPAA
jgi:hypothetical protein